MESPAPLTAVFHKSESRLNIKIKHPSFWEASAGPPSIMRLPSQLWGRADSLCTCWSRLLGGLCLKTWRNVSLTCLMFFIPTRYNTVLKALLLQSYLGSGLALSLAPIKLFSTLIGGFPGVSVVKNPPTNVGNIGDEGFTPGLGRSPGGGNRNTLQHSFVCRISWTEEPGGLQSIASQSQTWLSTHTVLIIDCLLITLIDIALNFIWQLCTDTTHSVP